MLASATAAAIEHVLASAPWAREALAPYGGRRLRLRSGLVDVALLVTAHGGVAAAESGNPVDLEVNLPPAAAARLAAGDESAYAEARIDGDAEFAVVIRRLAIELRWDFEEDIARVLGDVAAHRTAGALRSTVAYGRAAAGRAVSAVTEYVTEEGRMTPPRAELEAWMADVDAVREDAERLLRRVERLERTRHNRG
jgi:ubiquinone biosynthesis protein UbiJ